MEPFTIGDTTYRLLPGDLLHGGSSDREHLFDLRAIVGMNALSIETVLPSPPAPSQSPTPYVKLETVANMYKNVQFATLAQAEAFVAHVSELLPGEGSRYHPDSVGFASLPLMWVHNVRYRITDYTNVIAVDAYSVSTANAWQDVMTRA